MHSSSRSSRRDTSCIHFRLGTGLVSVCSLLDSQPYLFRSHEQQMLHRMRHTRHIFLVREVSHIDIQRRTGLVGLVVMHQQGLQLIREFYHSILSVVRLRLLQPIGYPSNRMHDCSEMSRCCKTVGQWRIGSESAKDRSESVRVFLSQKRQTMAGQRPGE